MNYFFYKDYMFNKMIKHSNPLWVSAIMVSLIQFTNALAIFIVLNNQILHFEPSKATIMICMIIIGIILFVLNANYFKKNEMQIYEKYHGEKVLKSVLGYIFYVSYLIGSFVLLYILDEKLGYHL
jgi:uncharacterized membrane protein YidH (DUF202 family)